MFEKNSRMIKLPTSGWQNHCALASLGHYLDEALKKADLSSNQGSFRTKPFEALLESFKQTFQEPNLTWEDIRSLSSQHDHPFDQQALWALPLRHFLSQTLTQSPELKETLYPQFLALSNLIYDIIDSQAENQQEILSHYFSLYFSNLGFFFQMKKAIKTNPELYLDRKDLEEKLIKPYWEKLAFDRYCKFMGGELHLEGEGGFEKSSELINPMISADELSTVCEALHIKLNVYGPSEEMDSVDYSKPYDTVKGYRGNQALGELTVGNLGDHWERVLGLKAEELNLNSSETEEDSELYYKKLQYLSPTLAKKENRSSMVQHHLKKSLEKLKHKDANLLPFDLKIYSAIQKSDYKQFQECIAEGADLFSLTPLGNTLIDELLKRKDAVLLVGAMISNEQYHNHIISKLLEDKQDDYIKRLYYYNVLYQISQKMDEGKSIESLVYAFDKYGATEGVPSIKEAKRFLWIGYTTRNVLPLAQNAVSGLTVLHAACLQNDKKLFDIAIAQLSESFYYYSFEQKVGFPHLNIPDATGMTPLHYIALLGRENWIKPLHEANRNAGHNQVALDYTLQDIHGNTPLHLAVLSHHKNTLKELATYIKDSVRVPNNKRAQACLKNTIGLTPISLAIQEKQWEMVVCLLENDLWQDEDVMELSSLLPYLIENKMNIHLDKLVSRRPMIVLEPGHEGLLHDAIRHLNYQAIHILLHGLSLEQRKKLVALKNTEGENAFQYLKKRDGFTLKSYEDQSAYEKSNDYKIFHKMARLLGQYDVAAREWAGSNPVSYQINLNDDIKEELRSTDTYRTLTTAYTFYDTARNVGSALKVSWNPLFLIEVGVTTFFGGDVIDKAERLTNLKANDGTHLGQAAHYASKAFYYINFWRRTTSKVTSLVLGNTASYLLSTRPINAMTHYTVSFLSQAPSTGYLTTLEVSSAAYFAADTYISDRHLGPYLSQYWTGLESSAKNHLDIPTLNEVVGMGASKAHDFIENQTGIHVERNLAQGYLWLRRACRLEGDLLDEYLKIKAMTPEELTYYLKTISYGQYVQRYSPEMLVHVIMEMTIGHPDKLVLVAEFLANCLADYQYEALQMTTDERNIAFLEYFHELKVEQFKVSYENNQKKYIEILRDYLNDKIRKIEEKGVQQCVEKYKQNGSNAEVLLNDILDLIRVSPVEKDYFKVFIQHTIDSNWYDQSKLQKKLFEIVTAVASPMQASETTLTFLLEFGEYMKNHQAMNVGQVMGGAITIMLLEGGYITPEQRDSIYSDISFQCNQHYWNDHKKGKTDFRKSMKGMLEVYFNATQWNNPKNREGMNWMNGTQAWHINEKVNKGDEKTRVSRTMDAIKEEFPSWFENPDLVDSLFNALKKCKVDVEYTQTIYRFILLYSTPEFMNAYLNNSRLYSEAKAFNEIYKPREVKASFAVNWIAQALANTPGYTPLTETEKYTLMVHLIDTKNKGDFEKKIVDAIREHQVGSSRNINNMSVIYFAKEVEVKAHHYGENRWHETSKLDTRKINDYDPLSSDKKFLYNLVEALTLNGVKINYHIDAGYQANLFNVGGYDFNSGKFLPHGRPEKKKEVKVVELSEVPRSCVFIEPTGALANDLYLGGSHEQGTQAENSSVNQSPDPYSPYLDMYGMTFGANFTNLPKDNAAPLLQEMQAGRADANQSANPEFDAFMGPAKEMTPLDVMMQTLYDNPLPGTLDENELARIRAVEAEKAHAPVLEKSSFWRMLNKFNPIGTAEAHPIFWAGAAATGKLGVEVGLTAYKLQPDDKNHPKNPFLFPGRDPMEEAFAEATGKLEGKDPNRKDINETQEGLPSHQEGRFSTETPINQPGKGVDKYILPAAPMAGLMMYLYEKYVKNSGGTASLVQHERQKEELRIEEGLKATFKADGTLTEEAIKKSTVIQHLEKYGTSNPLLGELEKRGDLNDWKKCASPKFYTTVPSKLNEEKRISVNAEVHFYKNIKTGEIYYEKDYKVKYQITDTPWVSVSEFLAMFPNELRPKP